MGPQAICEVHKRLGRVVDAGVENVAVEEATPWCLALQQRAREGPGVAQPPLRRAAGGARLRQGGQVGEAADVHGAGYVLDAARVEEGSARLPVEGNLHQLVLHEVLQVLLLRAGRGTEPLLRGQGHGAHVLLAGDAALGRDELPDEGGAHAQVPGPGPPGEAHAGRCSAPGDAGGSVEERQAEELLRPLLRQHLWLHPVAPQDNFRPRARGRDPSRHG
mmetsp:Transcript_72920/g.226598  ORF Transcript_72920/g.226598 Transcript_72920/m.226598 type:complete len:219 (-) Transcript_72920:801-1457(-)